MNTELLHFHQLIVTCTRPEDLFGTLTGDWNTALKTLYRRFAKIAHVDRYQRLDEQRLAHLAFSRLNELNKQAIDKIIAGTYGTAAAAPKKTHTPATIRTKRGLYVVTDGLAVGDVSTIYTAEHEGKTPVLLKISSHHQHNSFLEVEAKALAALSALTADTQSYKQFIPQLVDQVNVAINNSVRHINIFSRQEGFRSLTDVMVQYPEGINPRHFVWIFNRLLTTLSFTHSAKIIHGAVLPTHVLIHPLSHGIQLIDWCFAAPRNGHVIAMSNGYTAWYPPEVKAKKPVTPATDIYMAAMCMSYILGVDFGESFNKTNLPPKFQRLLTTCLFANPARRPQSAWELYKEVGEISQDVFGPRKYIPLAMT